MSSIELPNVVRRAHAKAFAEQIGLEPATVKSLEIVTDGVWATLFASDSEGRIALTNGEAACHRMFIPFDHAGD